MNWPLKIPPVIHDQLEQGAVVAVSISGGKDSQAMLKAVTHALAYRDYPNEVFAIHAHLGRAEWPQTMAHCQRICDEVGVQLVVVHREKGDLLQRWEERKEKLKGTGKPFWSSAKNRYCTSDMKRGPIDKYLRNFDRVISVEGIRAEESRARAKKPEYELRKQICTKTRTALTWRPILHWTDQDVYRADGMSIALRNIARELYQRKGEVPDWWNYHPAYAMGNDRLSCAICVLASVSDIKNGIRHNPELAETLIGWEEETGHTFRHKQSLKEMREQMEKEPAL